MKTTCSGSFFTTVLFVLSCTSFDAPPVLSAFRRPPPVSNMPVRLHFSVTVKDGLPNVMDMSYIMDEIGVTCPTRVASASSTLMTSSGGGTGFSIFSVVMTSSSNSANVNGNFSPCFLFNARNGQRFGTSASWNLYSVF